jgi:CMP-2-keto-3-deoxyoctulosonic acid synthetase
MWKERLKRIAIIVIVGGLVFWGIESFAKRQETKRIAGASIGLSTQGVTQKIEDFGEKVLGKAVEILPGGDKIKKIKEEEKENQTNRIEIQPGEAPKILENQMKEIIEILKQLPEEQLKQIKKQIFKDFCQEVMGE